LRREPRIHLHGIAGSFAQQCHHFHFRQWRGWMGRQKGWGLDVGTVLGLDGE
jgi:hypothetical protein